MFSKTFEKALDAVSNVANDCHEDKIKEQIAHENNNRYILGPYQVWHDAGLLDDGYENFLVANKFIREVKNDKA